MSGAEVPITKVYGGVPAIAPPVTDADPRGAHTPLELNAALVSQSITYWVIVSPPDDVGGEKATSSSVPDTTDSFTEVGAVGIFLGITVTVLDVGP